MDTAPQDGTEIVLHTPGAFCSYAVARWLAFTDGTGGAWLTDRNVACKACGETNTLQVVDPAGWLTIGEALSAAPADDDVKRVALAIQRTVYPRDARGKVENPSGVMRDAALAAIAAMPVQSPPPADDEDEMREQMRRGEYVPPMRTFSIQSPPPIMGEGLIARVAETISKLTGLDLEDCHTPARAAFSMITNDLRSALATPSSQEKHHGR